MDTLRKKLIRLAHDQPEIRSDILPLLQKVAGPWDVGAIRRFWSWGHEGTGFKVPFEVGEELEIVGLKKDQFTWIGPKPFVDFFWVVRVNDPQKKKVLIPPHALDPSLKPRDSYKSAVAWVGRILRKGGLKQFKRRKIGTYLGWENQGALVGVEKVEKLLLRHPSIKGSSYNNSLVLEVPFSQTETRDYPLRVWELGGERVEVYPPGNRMR